MTPEIEATGAERIAQALAEDGREIIGPYFPAEDVEAWATGCAGAVSQAMEMKALIRGYARTRQDALVRLRAMQKEISDRHARRRFENIISRIARATDVTKEVT